MKTPTKNILVRLPAEVARRLDSLVPRRKRNQFIVQRVSEVIEEHDAELARVATLVTKNESSHKELRQLLQDWEVVSGDGISPSKDSHVVT